MTTYPPKGTSFETHVPHPVLTPITGKPTFLSIQRLEAELYANAFAIPSILGDGASGHTVIVIGSAAYRTLTGVEFNIPTNPGAHPVPSASATDRAIKTAAARHATAKENFEKYINAANLLRTQLLAAIEKKYYIDLSDRITGMSRVTVFEILNHLKAENGKISHTDLKNNKINLEAPWELDTTMSTLWTRAADAVEIGAQGGEPINNATLIRTLRQVLKETGAFTRAIETWDDKEKAQQTWSNFKDHFTAANQRRLDEASSITVTEAGFQGHHAINAATQNQQPVIPPATNPVPSSLTGYSYCWSHGLTRNHSHNSRTCRKKAPGHHEDATIDNMKGGNNSIQRPRGERVQYVPPNYSNNNNNNSNNQNNQH